MRLAIMVALLCGSLAQAQNLSTATEAQLRLEIQARNKARTLAWIDSTTAIKAIVATGQVVIVADTVAGDPKNHVRIWFNLTTTTGDRKRLLGLAKASLAAVPYVGKEIGGDTVRVELNEARRWAMWVEGALR